MQQAVKQPVLLASLTSLINPATIIPIASVGFASWVVFKVVRSLKGSERLESGSEPVKTPIETVPYREDEPLQTVNPTGSEQVQPFNEPVKSNRSNLYRDLNDEELKREMIRQTMSELGKRSALKRIKKDI